MKAQVGFVLWGERNLHSGRHPKLLRLGEQWGELDAPIGLKSQHAQIEGPVKIGSEKKTIERIEPLGIVRRSPGFDMRCDKQPRIPEARHGTGVPMEEQLLPKGSLPDSGFDQAALLGLAQVVVFNDGINVCFDVAAKAFGEVFSEFRQCVAIHVVPALITLLENWEYPDHCCNFSKSGWTGEGRQWTDHEAGVGGPSGQRAGDGSRVFLHRRRPEAAVNHPILKSHRMAFLTLQIK